LGWGAVVLLALVQHARFLLVGSGRGVWCCVVWRAAGWSGQLVKTAVQRVSQAWALGQWVGRCSTGWRCGRASRAGMLIRWVRRVAPRAAV
jgi:hypothetical protein